MPVVHSLSTKKGRKQAMDLITDVESREFRHPRDQTAAIREIIEVYKAQVTDLMEQDRRWDLTVMSLPSDPVKRGAFKRIVMTRGGLSKSQVDHALATSTATLSFRDEGTAKTVKQELIDTGCAVIINLMS